MTKINSHLLLLLAAGVLILGLLFPRLAQADSLAVSKNKELNFVFLHGMNGNSGSMQLLADCVEAQLPAYVTNYQYEHSDLQIQTDLLNRGYPNDVDIESWASNIAEAVNQHFKGKKNLVLVGHSMGGKTALYAVAHNIGNLADKVAMVVTIDSPIKSLVNYYYVGGDTALDYWGAQMLLSDRGVLQSLVNYDSSPDGQWVGANKHWLAFIAAESSPLSSQFDVSGIDALPRQMDDRIVPISCQYADGADVVYYGQYGHSDFGESQEVSSYLADQLLRYIFGGNVQCSVFARAGSFEHKAGLLPGTDHWSDLVGGVLAGSGTLLHKNESYIKWQNWMDTVGDDLNGSLRSSFQTSQKTSFPIMTGLRQINWANPDDARNGKLNIQTRAAPRSSVQVDWSVYEEGLLPAGIERDHYEVELETGTQFTSIGDIVWETNDRQDVRLRIASQAQSPFRWFKVQWRVYYKESRQRQIIDSLPF
jgi:pimeloyl-ACP methyl ester carboxylesterase